MKEHGKERENAPLSGSRETLAREAKAIVAIAFRNGPLEDVHAGKPCPVCEGKQEYSHITDAEMKNIMRTAVNRVFTLLVLRQENPPAFAASLEFGARYTRSWDDPVLTTKF